MPSRSNALAVPPPEVSTWARTLAEDLGEAQAARVAGVDRLTLVRAVAGLPMQGRTRDHLARRQAEGQAAAASATPAAQMKLPL